jgi:TolA-binding protein
MTCPGDLELSRALTVGADPEIAAHIARCATCRAAWDAEQAAIELARELPVAIPPPAHREEVRTAVLAASASVPDRLTRRAWLAPTVLGAAAAGVVAYVAIPRGSSQPAPARPMRATVHPHPGARYAASSPSPDEVVQLTDGVIDVDVDPLRPGERFRVIVGDAELEVHGTTFTVSASDQHLTEVSVSRGRVDLRSRSSTPATLTAGESWRARPAAVVVEASPSQPVPQAPSASLQRSPASVRPPSPPPPPQARPLAIAPSPSPPRTPHAAPLRPHRGAGPAMPHDAEPAVSSHPASSAPLMDAPTAAERSVAERGAAERGIPARGDGGRTAEELSYDQAWDALRANNFGRAASGFGRVVLLAPDGPLVEDASFWRAVALARGQRSAEALSALRDFLDSYGASPRAGEVSAMLGWMLIDARAYDEAARRFATAVRDASPAVRRSAKAGLDALARRKQ